MLERRLGIKIGGIVLGGLMVGCSSDLTVDEGVVFDKKYTQPHSVTGIKDKKSVTSLVPESYAVSIAQCPPEVIPSPNKTPKKFTLPPVEVIKEKCKTNTFKITHDNYEELKIGEWTKITHPIIN